MNRNNLHTILFSVVSFVVNIFSSLLRQFRILSAFYLCFFFFICDPQHYSLDILRQVKVIIWKYNSFCIPVLQLSVVMPSQPEGKGPEKSIYWVPPTGIRFFFFYDRSIYCCLVSLINCDYQWAWQLAFSKFLGEGSNKMTNCVVATHTCTWEFSLYYSAMDSW